MKQTAARTQLAVPAPTAAVPRAAAGKYLSFGLADESYAFDVLRVREIIGLVPITPLPGVAGYVEGVVNLRGRIVPVLDLRRRLGLPARPPRPETCIVVLEIDTEAGPARTGCIVDRVDDVCAIAEAEIEEVPGREAGAGFVRGLARHEGRVLILLDAAAVVTGSEPPVAATDRAAPTA